MHNKSLIQMGRPWPASFFGGVKSANTERIKAKFRLSKPEFCLNREMARKPVYKTPLGRRLAEVREEFGKDRDEFVAMLGDVSAKSLANYERGDNVPDASVLLAYQEKLGVSVAWLISEKGDMFDDPSKAPAPSIEVDPWIMERLYAAADLAYKEIGRPISGIAVAREATVLFNVLLKRVSDLRDRPMVEAGIKVLTDELKQRLRTAEPGTGKASA